MCFLIDLHQVTIQRVSLSQSQVKMHLQNGIRIHSHLDAFVFYKGRYTHSVKTERFYCVTSYLTEKLGKLRSFDRQRRRLRTVHSSRLSHRELHSSPRESNSFLSLPLFLSTATCTRRNIQLTNLMRNLCCGREHSVQFFVQFFFLFCTVKLRNLT